MLPTDDLAQSSRPLCVDLDGTLLRGDMLHESLLRLISINPLYIFLLPFWLFGGKARFKREISSRVNIDPASLIYDDRVIELLKKTNARPRVLCSATDEKFTHSIAEFLMLFDEVASSNGRINLAGRAKAKYLVDRFGERGFDYMGNAPIDLAVWERAAGAWVVNGDKSLASKASAVTNVRGVLPKTTAAGIKTWIKAIRVHQWLKNLLIFLPVLASHRLFEPHAVAVSLLAFLSFGLCASGVYVLNDLLDLESDRKHPRKRLRAFAAGVLPINQGLLAAPTLTLAGFALAWIIGPSFFMVILGYYALTLAYSLRLKRVVMVDVILLAALYTIRIIAGTVAISAPLSFWLLAFSMFVFLSLAMLKRYTELDAMLSSGKRAASGRGYKVEDLALIQSLGASSGYIAVLVLALYINSPESLLLYSHPKVLWLVCPVLLYWMSRVWIIAHRGGMDDDPVVFAAKDNVSRIVIAVCGVLAVAAL